MSLFYFDNSFQVQYAGHNIYCKGGLGFRFFKFMYGCTCVDISTNTSIRCSNYKSQGGACEHALSNLVQIMSKKGLYSLPTDFSSMPKEC